MNLAITLLTLLIVVFTSCQKEAADQLPVASLKVKTYTEDVTSAFWGQSVTTFNLGYDGNDRLVSMTDSADPGTRFIFGYPTSSKYTLDIFVDNQKDIHADYFLNSHLLVDSSFQHNSDGDTMTEKYIYNPAHKVTKLYEYDYSSISGAELWNTTSYTYDGAGNLTRSEDTDQYVYTYEYYSDKVYLMPRLVPMMVPDQKANLVKKITLSESGTVTGHVTHTYTFDSKDRISTIRNDYSDGDVVIKTFTYFD